MSKLTVDSFLESLMVLPKKPEFIGFTMDTETLFEKMVEKLNEIAGRDLSPYCSHDTADDMEFLFYIDEYMLQEEEQDWDDILAALPFEHDAPWETSQYLVGKVFGADTTWAYAQQRYHESSTCEIQIGIPRNL
jgi:hypothetical protein